MAIESEEILSKISELIESKVDELSTNLNNFRQEASNNNQTLENAIGSIKSVIDEKLSKIDQISSEINSIQTSVQSVADNVSATNNKIDNILSQQTQLQRAVDSVSQNIEKLSTVTSNQLTYLSNQSQNITEKIDKLSLQQERESRTAAVEGARGTVVVDSATGKTVSGVAAADATGDGEETKQSLIGSVLSGIKGILTSPLALGSAALGAAALGTAYALRKEPPGTPQAGSDAEFNLPRDTSGSRRTGGQTDQGPSLSPSGTTPSSGEYSGNLARDRKAAFEKELENPAVIRRLYNLSRTEVGKNPINQQLFSETVFNRSMFTDRSLSSTMSSVRSEGVRGGYYPVIKNYNPSPEELKRFKQSVINKIMSGANNTSMATDNASLDVARRRIEAGVHGQYLGVGKKDVTKDLYYSGGRGAGRYRTKHGIRAQEYQRRLEQERQQQSRQETETAPHSDARREPSQRQETSGYEIPDNVSFSSQSVERRASNLNEETKQSLKNFKRLAEPGTVITSTHRSERHSIERRKRRPGAHTRGQAIDIRTRGVSKEDLQKNIQALKRSGFNYILLEGNPPHIHAERRPRQKGFIIRNLGRGNPHISLSDAREAADQVELNDAQRQLDKSNQQEKSQRQTDAEKQPDADVLQPGDKKLEPRGEIVPKDTPPMTPEEKRRKDIATGKIEDETKPVPENKEPDKTDTSPDDGNKRRNEEKKQGRSQKVDLIPKPNLLNENQKKLINDLIEYLKERDQTRANQEPQQTKISPLPGPMNEKLYDPTTFRNNQNTKETTAVRRAKLPDHFQLKLSEVIEV